MIGRILKIAALLFAFFALAGVSAYFALTFFVGSESATVVPDLAGKHVVSALTLLSDLSLDTKIKGLSYSSDIPMHHVISQDPLPGIEIKPGRDVRITLSKGPETVRVPALTGLSYDQARIVLNENGLLIGNVARVHRDNASTGIILAQTPIAGKTIHRNQAVGLLVSLDKRPVDFIMPDLSGLSIDEAIQRIERVRLTLGSVESVFMAGRPANRIIGQTPLPGYRVFEKETVRLTINRHGAEAGKTIAPRSELLLIRHRTAPGFLNRHIRLQLNGFGLSVTLFDRFVKPGNEVWCFIPAESNSTAFLYEDDVLIQSEVIE